MPWLDLREPLSAATHGLGALLALPALVWLWHRGAGIRGRQISLAVYSLGLLACYSASAAFHGVTGSSTRIEAFAVADRVGIYLLIAGTYTPIAWNILSGPRRAMTLSAAWLFAGSGAAMHAAFGLVPHWISTVLYLAMGWGSVLCLGEITRRVSRADVRWLLLGGVFYSVGAALNLARWPDPWPGTFGFHEIFHLFVIAGSLAHFTFVVRTVVQSIPTRRSPEIAMDVPPRPKFLTPPYRRSKVR